jgi:glycine C-acetyltransferase
MPSDRLDLALTAEWEALQRSGAAKGAERIVQAVRPAQGNRGPRVLLDGHGDREFIRLNSNSYLGLSLHPELLAAEEWEARNSGVGPGAVRFISGSYRSHATLEARLARFHGREDAIAFSSAYAAVLGTLTPLITSRTLVLSDALNHNCIIQAIRMARPLEKSVYPHLDLDALDEALAAGRGRADRAVVVTDGVFSMRGDHAPLDEILELARRHDPDYPENVVVVVDDSHGVGAFGETGRGTEEQVGSPPVDLLIGTLGKAFGVNGGYAVGSRTLVRFLRETAPTYVYSNPITPGEAAAAARAVELVDSDEGKARLRRLRTLTRRFEEGLRSQGLETIPGEHPVVPILVRETERTRALERHLFERAVLVTGLAHPVVPRGDEAIRTQINADHTEADLDRVLAELRSFSP